MAGSTAEQIAAVDPSRQIDDVLALPDHLQDALWRVETAGLDKYGPLSEGEDHRALLVCGMGGSAVGGDLAAAALGDRLTRPMATVRGYELPSWATPEFVALCSSYSGGTEETQIRSALQVAEQAIDALNGKPLIAENRVA